MIRTQWQASPSKRNIKNISSASFLTLTKTLGGNKIATIEILKNLSVGVDFKL